MAIKSILTNQEDFTGEFPVTERTSALWRFNESAPDGGLRLLDSSGHGRHFTVSGWSGLRRLDCRKIRAIFPSKHRQPDF